MALTIIIMSDIKFCFIQVHIKQECSLVIMACPNGCGEKISKKDVSAIGVLLNLFFSLPLKNQYNVHAIASSLVHSQLLCNLKR